MDLSNSGEGVVILSPFLSTNRAIHYYPILMSLTARGVKVDVYTKPQNEQPESLRELYWQVETGLLQSGVSVHTRPGMHEKVGIVDNQILWHGSLNILSHWQVPKGRVSFEDHKSLNNRKVLCGGNAESYHLGYRFQTDVLILNFEQIPDEHRESEEFYTSLKSAIIQATASVVSAEDDEIDGFVRTVMKAEESPRRQLVLFDDASGGSGYVRKASSNLHEILAAARALLDNCHCDKSCYRCLRTYENQFEHRLLDKRIIEPYLDQVLA